MHSVVRLLSDQDHRPVVFIYHFWTSGLCEIDLIPEEKTLVRPECWDNWVVPRLWSGSTVGWQDDYYDVDDNDGECIGNDHHDDANAKPVWYWRPSQ